MLSDEQLTSFRQSLYLAMVEEIGKARKDAGLEKRYMNKKEACEYLHVANNTFDKWLELGMPKIVVSGSVRYDKQALDEWLHENVR